MSLINILSLINTVLLVVLIYTVFQISSKQPGTTKGEPANFDDDFERGVIEVMAGNVFWRSPAAKNAFYDFAFSDNISVPANQKWLMKLLRGLETKTSEPITKTNEPKMTMSKNQNSDHGPALTETKEETSSSMVGVPVTGQQKKKRTRRTREQVAADRAAAAAAETTNKPPVSAAAPQNPLEIARGILGPNTGSSAVQESPQQALDNMFSQPLKIND